MILADRAQLQSEIERLVASHALHGSESLCKLLRYLAKQAVEHPGVPVKEYQIATEVFGRQSDFDPQLDSMVRVQVGRLRSKLSEYYSGEGANDTTGVEIPKGSYAVVLHDRVVGIPQNGHVDLPQNGVRESHSPKGWAIAVAALSIALVAAIALSVRFYNRGPIDRPQDLAAEAAAPFR